MRSVFVRHRWEPYLWILPSILLMLVFVVFPIGIVFRLAFSHISRAGVVGGFIGLKNFQDAVSSPAFPQVMMNTAFWVVSVVGLSTLIGFICAMVLNQPFLDLTGYGVIIGIVDTGIDYTEKVFQFEDGTTLPVIFKDSLYVTNIAPLCTDVSILINGKNYSSSSTETYDEKVPVSGRKPYDPRIHGLCLSHGQSERRPVHEPYHRHYRPGHRQEGNLQRRRHGRGNRIRRALYLQEHE